MTAKPLHALTIDVEEHFHAQAIARHANSAECRQSRVERNTAKILEILSEHGITATFFVLGRVAEEHPNVVREIQAAGHEIACHGLSHELIYRQDIVEFRDETVRAKRVLEDVTGTAVLGYRASTFSVRRDTLWALEVIAEAGFTYDSSIVPARHDLYGLPKTPATPYTVVIDGRGEITEAPVATISLCGPRMIVGGGGYFRQFPYWFTRWALRRLEASDDPFVFYLHPWEFDPDQPKVAGLSWLSRLRHYTNLDKTEARLRMLIRDFRFGTMRDLLAQIPPDAPSIRLVDLGIPSTQAA
jgi:polysaccharide deacetylase family protein (PEP-CTERM system associated)